MLRGEEEPAVDPGKVTTEADREERDNGRENPQLKGSGGGGISMEG